MLGDGLVLGDGLALGEGLALGGGLVLLVWLLLGEGLADGLLLGEALPLPVGLGLPLADGLSLAVGLWLAAGLVLAGRRGCGLAVRDAGTEPVADVSSTPDSESALAVSAGRAPHGDFEPGGGTSRAEATATPSMLQERMEIPANVLSAMNPARRILTGTAAP